MFKSLVYCNTEKLFEYMSLLKGSKQIRFKNVTQVNEYGLQGNLKVASGNKNQTTNLTGEIEENILYDYNEFENLLSDNEDFFFDFTEFDENYDIETIRNSSIIKFPGIVTIPVEFDMIELMEKFKPLLIKSASTQMSDTEKSALEEFFKSNTLKIPIFSSISDKTVFGKLSSEFLLTSYNDLEDLENTDVVILAKIIAHKHVSDKTIIYDPLKEFIQLNRSTRRSMETSRPAELSPIYIDTNYINVEIIAIYQ